MRRRKWQKSQDLKMKPPIPEAHGTLEHVSRRVQSTEYSIAENAHRDDSLDHNNNKKPWNN